MAKMTQINGTTSIVTSRQTGQTTTTMTKKYEARCYDELRWRSSNESIGRTDDHSDLRRKIDSFDDCCSCSR